MFSNLRKYFLSGLVVFLPIALTIYLFYLAIKFADNFFTKFFDKFGFEVGGYYGLSILFGIWIIIVIGFFTTNFLGHRTPGQPLSKRQKKPWPRFTEKLASTARWW